MRPGVGLLGFSLICPSVAIKPGGVCLGLLLGDVCLVLSDIHRITALVRVKLQLFKDFGNAKSST
jgi:hypothetical protein